MITNFLTDEKKLESLLASTVSESNQMLIWLGITTILPMIFSLIFFWLANKFNLNKFCQNLAKELLLGVPRVISSFGSLVTGVMLAAGLYLNNHPNPKVSLIGFLSTISAFSIVFFITGAFLNFLAYEFVNKKFNL